MKDGSINPVLKFLALIGSLRVVVLGGLYLGQNPAFSFISPVMKWLCVCRFVVLLCELTL